MAMRLAQMRRDNWGKNKSKEFSEGRWTASQTGAKKEAKRKWEEDKAIEQARKVRKASKNTKSFEDYIRGGD